VRVVWPPSALQDIFNIYNYIADYNPGTASGLIDALLDAVDSLTKFPRRGRPVGDNLRELTVVYPYIIRYEVLGNDVTILRFRQCMRRP
jgi:toxin ParE1/3/4